MTKPFVARAPKKLSQKHQAIAFAANVYGSTIQAFTSIADAEYAADCLRRNDFIVDIESHKIWHARNADDAQATFVYTLVCKRAAK
jgi:hypothetical protein